MKGNRINLLVVALLTVVLSVAGTTAFVRALYIPGWFGTWDGTKHDECHSMIQTGDGGYALAGYTCYFGAGGSDFWLVKTDSSGNVLWSQTYGGTKDEEAYSVVQTSDGGYALAGATQPQGAGRSDFLLVKTDSAGNMLWSQTYGGEQDDYGRTVVQTSDGGYALAGATNSFGAGGYDFWLIKTDSAGNIQWNKTYGGATDDEGYSVVQTSDGYALAGGTSSFGAGGYDFWLVKTDSVGTMLWSQTYGGAQGDFARFLIQTSDGGYALASATNSFGAGGCDFFLVKTDALGIMEWSQTYGGTNDDFARSVVQTSDAGYALAGTTLSYGAGQSDFWLVKTRADGSIEWSQTYGGTKYDEAHWGVQTSDGYALAGGTSSFGAGGYDFWLVKTDSVGTMLWSQTYGGGPKG